MQAFPLGSIIRLSWEYRNKISGALYDPATPKFTFKKPDNTETTYTYPTDAQVVKDAVGKYHLDLSVDQVGFYRLRGWATGTGQASTSNWSIQVEAAI